MTNTPVTHGEWSKPMWGAIGKYIASIAVWAITCLVLLEMDLEDPIRLVAIAWGVTYLPILLVGLICAILARVCGMWQLYIHSLLIPLYTTLVFVAAAADFQIERYQARATFWTDPPTHISELKIGTAFEGATEDSVFTNAFFIPDGVTKTDLLKWDGEKLIFKTTMSPQAVRGFYSHIYHDIVDFSLIYTSSYSDYGYRINNKACFRSIIVNDEKQQFTQVRIVSCQEIGDCWNFEWDE